MNSLKVATRQLFLNTTLHGCRHIVEEKRHWIERVIWVLVQAAAMYGIAQSILDVYLEYLATPSVTSLESTTYPAWNLPFPAVGICNVNKISKREAMLLADELSSIKNTKHSKSEIFEILHSLGHIYDVEPVSFKTLQDLHDLLTTYNKSIESLLERLTPPCSTLLLQCRWKGQRRSCHELFKPTATVNGYCCVFNMFHNENGDAEKFPENLQSTGYRSGLSVIVDPKQEDYFFPIIPTYGVQVMIFSPLNRPENNNGIIEYIATRGREFFYTIDIFSQFSVSELENFDPSDRGCLFRFETTSGYSSTNCLAACLRNLMLDSCKCQPFYVRQNGSTKTCDLSDIPCLARSSVKFAELLELDSNEEENDSPCGKCLPACSNTWYDVQSSFAEIIGRSDDLKLNLSKRLEINEQVCTLHFYYSTLDTTLYKQDVLYTRSELVSNFGGMCSLFNGFSFLSLVEIIYFLTIRFFFIYQDGNRKKNIRDLEISKISHEPAPYWSEIQSRAMQSSGNYMIKYNLTSETIWDNGFAGIDL